MGDNSLSNNPTSSISGKGSSTLNADVELNAIRSDAPNNSVPPGEDIMQLARIGEIGAMQSLFTAKKFTANYSDGEGITPLHVRLPFPLIACLSGLQSDFFSPN